MESGHVSTSYNIVRHAGAIYALAIFNHFHPDDRVIDAMIRAATFMQTNYMGHDPHSNALAVWSNPTGSEAELGAAGLGLVALTEAARARPGAIPMEQLQSLGHFVIFLQKADGSFFSKYRAESGPVADWQSLYYPGEAALGLIDLYEIDHSRQWLVAAGKALSYLAKSRSGLDQLPDDHWALIASAKFLPYYDRTACPASREDLIRHATGISNAFLREQITSAADPRLVGGFSAEGRTTPTATRLEGLLAALEFLPSDVGEQRSRIETAVAGGIAFLLRAQVTSGPFAGGMPRTVFGPASVVMKADRRASEVRIDYVQHALCAWLLYEKLLQHRGPRRRAP